MKISNVIILTALPFRKYGNQSMLRFVKMFLNNNVNVDIFTSSKDKDKVNILENKDFKSHSFFSFHELLIKSKNKIISKPKQNEYNITKNRYHEIKSHDRLSPFGDFNYKTLIAKWFLFIVFLLDNVILILYTALFKKQIIKQADIIVGYECGYTFAAKSLSILFKKIYVNKFQGTILNAVGDNIGNAIKYFPLNYFGINKSNLCFMVNDGTNGDYYAKLRGCKNIYFGTHGVAATEYSKHIDKQLFKLSQYDNKFIIFNNASGSTWKRIDRIMRALNLVSLDTLNKLVVLTTYNGPDKTQLIEYSKFMKVQDHIIFLENVDYLISNYLIRNCDLLLMTNDVSNLGNPVLEAIYYKKPIITINDQELRGILYDKENSILINLDEHFDENLAKEITACVENKNYIEKIIEGAKKYNPVFSLEDQQKKEYEEIKKLFQ